MVKADSEVHKSPVVHNHQVSSSTVKHNLNTSDSQINESALKINNLDRTPHYALPILSSSAREFTNREQDIIRQCFTSGNHFSMKDFIGQRTTNRNRNPQRAQLAMPRELSTDLCNDTVLSDGEAYSTAFRPPGNRHRGKHESLFEVMSARREYYETHRGSLYPLGARTSYPYLGGFSGSLEEQLLRTKWIEDSRCIHKRAFVGGRAQLGLCDARLQLGLIVERLRHKLSEDCKSSVVSITCSREGIIQVAFQLCTVMSVEMVVKYMGALMKDALASEFGLRKLPGFWALRRQLNQTSQKSERDEWLLFLMAPLWVRTSPADAYYALSTKNERAMSMSMIGKRLFVTGCRSQATPLPIMNPTDLPTSPDTTNRSISDQRLTRKSKTSMWNLRHLEAGRPQRARRYDLQTILRAVEKLQAIDSCSSAEPPANETACA